MKKIYLIVIVFLSVFLKCNVYASDIDEELFLLVGEQYIIEEQEEISLTFTSENEEIATVEEKVITAKTQGETYILVNNWSCVKI